PPPPRPPAPVRTLLDHLCCESEQALLEFNEMTFANPPRIRSFEAGLTGGRISGGLQDRQ
ncbi:MAG: hypothetical protein ORN49_08980, partial [Rhodobacteraceae bacterium]|nr:hypothetical protein [Paracoccaceae bacterium]